MAHDIQADESTRNARSVEVTMLSRAGWLRAAWGPALLTLVAYGAFALLRLHLFNGDISRFVVAGEHFIPVASGAHVGLSVLRNSDGYDGQFYYLLALNPFSPHAALAGAHFDSPAYRAQRILYPLLVWLVTLGGHARYVPLALVTVNLAAIVAIAALAALAARRMGLHPSAGLMVAFYPGFLLSLARDLGEPVGIAFALGGLLCALNRRWGWAALLLSLAVLGRETTALFALALLLAGLLAGASPWLRLPRGLRLLPHDEWRGAALAGLAPLLVAVGWQGVLIARWGALGLRGGGHNFGSPFGGIMQAPAIWQASGWPQYVVQINALEALYLLGLAALVAFTIWTQRRVDHLALAWGGYLLLGISLTILVWVEDWAFMRGLVEFSVAGLLILVSARNSVRILTLLGTLSVWGAVVYSHLIYTPK